MVGVVTIDSALYGRLRGDYGGLRNEGTALLMLLVARNRSALNEAQLAHRGVRRLDSIARRYGE